ncbi:MAG: DUF2062 domain-containing protein [Steroidobacteraceae bacterium]
MPRRLLRRVLPNPDKLRNRWIFRAFGERLTDSRLWSLGRRSITVGFGTGLAIAFIPLPVHIPVALLAAIVWRLNVPVIFATVMLVNPVTAVPVYYLAYRVGSLLMGAEPHGFTFHPSWEWLQHGLGPLWKPFLLGCVSCSLVFGYSGYLALELLWRWITVRRLRGRRSTPGR